MIIVYLADALVVALLGQLAVSSWVGESLLGQDQHICPVALQRISRNPLG